MRTTGTKPPLSYYGGKQKMLKHLLPLVPPHEIYVEPFAGGAALFFAKRPAKVEVLNDINDNLITFYRVMKSDFDNLNGLIQGTLHSESDYRKAADIYRNPSEHSDLWRAWAVWVQCSMSFSIQPLNGFAFNLNIKKISIGGAKRRFANYRERLGNAFVFTRNATELPEIYNTPETFTYYDPPYVNSDCGHYKGYTAKDYGDLMIHATNRKGKFLISSYPNEILSCMVELFGWNYKEIRQTLAVDGRRKESKTKVEALAWNYDEPSKQNTLFS
jgi:DNA adenine methylase